MIARIVSTLLPCFALSMPALASILPKNNLHLEDNPSILANMTKEEFETIVNTIVDQYKPLAAIHGAQLKTNNLWENSTVNASAQQDGDTWMINMYGGLARRQEVTPDGFALVVCHELGHHFGGFAFKGERWAANEGQSDYFATQACARKIWKGQTDLNAEFRSSVGAYEKEKCDAAWSNADDQDLCYRVASAGLSLGTLLARLNRGRDPQFQTPDTRQVRSTDDNHPQAQCRLDTYLSGALCTVGFDERVIPGRKHPEGQGSRAAEEIAGKHSCLAGTQTTFAARPACWFKARVTGSAAR